MGACRERPFRRRTGIEQNDGATEREPVKPRLGQMRHPLILALILGDAGLR